MSRAALSEQPPTKAALRRAAERVRMRQIGGDDGYCWCVLVDGQVKWDGMKRSEAAWRRGLEIEALARKEIKR